ncbi:MAG: hypothetical protein H6737_22120 [Alphaproteobacteria bacterium]|nr:hypothetical protein [Alphaproteobacteria bacterium]
MTPTDPTPDPVPAQEAPAQGLSPLTWAAVLVVIAWGLWPFRVIVHHFAWKVDAIKWVTQGALDNPAWPRWVFRTNHFVGYRPVAAGSFVLNNAITGYHPEGYRIADFALHGLTAVAVAMLASRLFARRTAWVLLPVLLYLGHPAVEEALPYLARRSYLLATMFGLFGLVAWMDSLKSDAPISGKSWLASGMLALALFSNEAAYVLLPMLPLLAWHTRGSLVDAIRRSIIPWAPALPAIALRFAVLGWTGGYHKHYFAFTRAGKKTLREVYDFNFPDIVGAAYDYLWFPVSFKGDDTLTEWPVAVFLVTSFYFWALLVEPALSLRDRARRMPLLLAIWFFGYAALFGLSRTWFWRQGFAMVAPLALIVGYVAFDTWDRFRARPIELAARMVPQIALVVGLLWHSPMFRGMTVGPIQGRFDGNAALYALEHEVKRIDGPAQIYTVLPLNKGSNRNAQQWLDKLYKKRQLYFTTLANGLPQKGLARLDGEALVLGSQAAIPPGVQRAKNIENHRVILRSLHMPSRPVYVAFPDDRGQWTLHPVDSPAPAEGSRRRTPGPG